MINAGLTYRYDYAVVSCGGSLYTDNEGVVLFYQTDDESYEHYFANIVRFNFAEHRRVFGYVPTTIDILNLGYWTNSGFYSPPDWQFRIFMGVVTATTAIQKGSNMYVIHKLTEYRS